jgi:hypothetical protein
MQSYLDAESAASPVPQPPSRRFQPKVTVREEPLLRPSDRCNIFIHVNHLSDSQMERLKDIVSELPSLVDQISKEIRNQLWSTTWTTLAPTLEQVRALQVEAWDHERWHEAVLRELACLTVEEAEECCAHSPWDVHELLVLPLGGRRYVPAFQFLSDGSPHPAWATLMSVLLTVTRFDQWDLLAWLARPDSLLNNEPPISAIGKDPKRVLSLARLIDREGTL